MRKQAGESDLKGIVIWGSGGRKRKRKIWKWCPEFGDHEYVISFPKFPLVPPKNHQHALPKCHFSLLCLCHWAFSVSEWREKCANFGSFLGPEASSTAESLAFSVLPPSVRSDLALLRKWLIHSFRRGIRETKKEGFFFFSFFFFYAIAFQLKLVSLSVFFLLLQILQGGYFGGWATAGDRCIWSCSIVGSRSAGALERLMTAPAVGRFFFRKGFGVERCHRQMEGRKRVFFYLWNLLLLLGNASLSTMNSSHGGFFVWSGCEICVHRYSHNGEQWWGRSKKATDLDRM